METRWEMLIQPNRSVGSRLLCPLPPYWMSYTPTPNTVSPESSTHCNGLSSFLINSPFGGIWFHSTLVSSPSNHKPLWDFRMWLIPEFFFSPLNWVSLFFLGSAGFSQRQLSGYFTAAATCDFLLCSCQITRKLWGEWGERRTLVGNWQVPDLEA